MGECKLNHSPEDVKKKLVEQKEFLPAKIHEQFSQFLQKDLSQQTLNEAFHLLKKYDLASTEEQVARNEQMEVMFQQ